MMSESQLVDSAQKRSIGGRSAPRMLTCTSSKLLLRAPHRMLEPRIICFASPSRANHMHPSGGSSSGRLVVDDGPRVLLCPLCLGRHAVVVVRQAMESSRMTRCQGRGRSREVLARDMLPGNVRRQINPLVAWRIAAGTVQDVEQRRLEDAVQRVQRRDRVVGALKTALLVPTGQSGTRSWTAIMTL